MILRAKGKSVPKEEGAINSDILTFINLGRDFLRHRIERFFLKIYFSLLICVKYSAYPDVLRNSCGILIFLFRFTI